METIISFFSEDVALPDLNEDTIRRWLIDVAHQYERRISFVNYIFCSDAHLLEINRTHLDHDYLTDIITFDYEEDEIEGDVFISTDRVKDNAEQYQQERDQELRRIMVHGLLHLLGFKDKTPEDKQNMTNAENKALAFYHKKHGSEQSN